MEFIEAKKILKDGYTNAGFEFIDEHQNELFFKYRDINYSVTEQDIKEYALFQDIRHEFQAVSDDSGCGICSTNYRECVLKDSRYLRRPFPSEEPYVFKNTPEGSLYAEIGIASNQFINFFRFEDSYMQYCKERRRLFLSRSSGESDDIKNFHFRPYTIKIL